MKVGRLTGIAVLTSSLGIVGAALVCSGLPQGAGATAPVAVWSEVAWPFPIDQWGKGKAFRCKAADCGTEVNIYLRAKIGFCDCTTGVADDEALDRMGDLDLLGAASPLGTGSPVNISWMKGRSRVYMLNNPKPPGNSVISVVYNERCDMIAATAVLGHGWASAVEPTVIEFLNGRTVMRWAEITLGF